MPSWLPPVLILVVAGLVVALDVARRDRQGPRPEELPWFAHVTCVNRNDKRVVVPKRDGLGFGRTPNFAIRSRGSSSSPRWSLRPSAP